MPVYDYRCPTCAHLEENVLVAKPEEEVLCKACESVMQRLACAPHVFTTIVPTYPGSKALKAGYQHIGKPQPATKLQIGPGGGQSPENPKGGR